MVWAIDMLPTRATTQHIWAWRRVRTISEPVVLPDEQLAAVAARCFGRAYADHMLRLFSARLDGTNNGLLPVDELSAM